MLRELLTIFRSDNPLRAMGESFARMLQSTFDMTLSAGEAYFGSAVSPEDRTRIYEMDVRVNQLERSVRKQVVAHLSVAGNTPDVPYCLLLMSLVKDVERLGDYAKNLSEAVDVRLKPLPDDEIVQELREIRRGVEEAFRSASEIFATSDRERALRFIQQGRGLAHRCDALIQRIARSSYDASTTTALVLGTRYYKRIGGHVLNVLTSVVMPLHKIDYYDEDEVEAARS
ncbi:MAG: PhoU domain-containing protein [Acidobacteriota bacterium]